MWVSQLINGWRGGAKATVSFSQEPLHCAERAIALERQAGKLEPLPMKTVSRANDDHSMYGTRKARAGRQKRTSSVAYLGNARKNTRMNAVQADHKLF